MDATDTMNLRTYKVRDHDKSEFIDIAGYDEQCAAENFVENFYNASPTNFDLKQSNIIKIEVLSELNDTTFWDVIVEFTPTFLAYKPSQ